MKLDECRKRYVERLMSFGLDIEEADAIELFEEDMSESDATVDGSGEVDNGGISPEEAALQMANFIRLDRILRP